MSQWNNDTISSLSSVVRSVLNEEDGSKTETEAARKRQKGKKVSFEDENLDPSRFMPYSSQFKGESIDMDELIDALSNLSEEDIAETFDDEELDFMINSLQEEEEDVPLEDILEALEEELTEEELAAFFDSLTEEELDEIIQLPYYAVQKVRSKRKGTTIKGIEASDAERRAAKHAKKAADKPTSVRRAKIAGKAQQTATIRRAQREKERSKAKAIATGEGFEQQDEIVSTLRRAGGELSRSFSQGRRAGTFRNRGLGKAGAGASTASKVGAAAGRHRKKLALAALVAAKRSRPTNRVATDGPRATVVMRFAFPRTGAQRWSLLNQETLLKPTKEKRTLIIL